MLLVSPAGRFDDSVPGGTLRALPLLAALFAGDQDGPRAGLGATRLRSTLRSSWVGQRSTGGSGRGIREAAERRFSSEGDDPPGCGHRARIGARRRSMPCRLRTSRHAPMRSWTSSPSKAGPARQWQSRGRQLPPGAKIG